MSKRRRESAISFDQDGYAIIELDGLIYKWNISKKLKDELYSQVDELDISIVKIRGHRFIADIRSLRTNQTMAYEEVEMI